MRPVDVLVVSPPAAVWGAQLRLLDYAPALADRGVRLTLGSPEQGDLHAAWVAAGLRHRTVDVPFVAGIRSAETGRRPPPRDLASVLARVVRGATALRGAIGDYDAAWSFHLRAHPAAVAAAKLRRVPIAVEVVDIVLPGAGRRLLQMSAALADTTIVNSAATGATLEGRGRSVRVVHPGVDTSRYRPGDPAPGLRRELATDDTGVLVGIAGRVDPGKGIDVLVEALAQVPAGLGAHLVVVGDAGVSNSDYAARLAGHAGELLGPRARFVGRRADMPDVLRALDILVNASTAEPFGRSLLEGQATGLAVIGTRQGGIPEFVRHGETGLLVEPGNAPELAAAISALAGDSARRARIGAAARTQAVTRFDIVDRYDTVADILCALGRRR